MSSEHDTPADWTPSEVQTEVRAILDMYRELQRAKRGFQLSTTADLDVAFHGFDGNDEYEHHQYCQYLRDELGEYSDVETGPYGDNSHAESLMRHRSMLLAFRSLASSGRPLVEADIKYVLDAGLADRSRGLH